MATLLKNLTNSVKHWYVPLIIGILFVVFGIYIFTIPLETYLTLSILFSTSFIISGLFDIFFSIQNKEAVKGWGWYLVSGLLTFIVGVYLIMNPEVSMITLPFVVGFTLMFRSFQVLGFAFDLRHEGVLSWGNVAIGSVLGIVLSFLLLSSPIFTGISLVTLTAMSFIFTGIAAILLSLNLKKIKDVPSELSDELKTKISNLENEINKYLKK